MLVNMFGMQDMKLMLGDAPRAKTHEVQKALIRALPELVSIGEKILKTK